MTKEYHKLDKMVSVMQFELRSMQHSIDEIREKLDEVLDNIEKDLSAIKTRHMLEDRDADRKTARRNFILTNWKFLSVLSVTFFSLLFGGYEFAMKLHDSIPQNMKVQMK